MGSAQLQGQLWGRHPEVWASTLETQMRPIYLAALDALRPLEGSRLLDAGCGAGLALSEAAARGAVVSGLDASAALLEVAGRRVPAADLRQGDIEALPFRTLAPPPPGTPAPLACSDAGVVEELLSRAGLQVGAGAEVPVPFAFEDLDQAWIAHSSSGALQKVIDTTGADVVREVITAVLTTDRKPDGAFRQDNVFRYVLARKP